MGFYSSDLQHYDPMKDEVSWAPIQQARDITWRARYLLRGRTAQDVRWLGAELESWIDAYFDNEKENSIQMLKDEGRYDLLESDDEGMYWSIKSEASDDYDIRTSDNTRPIDAAKEVFETMDILHEPDVKDAKEYEYFAAMSLAMIGTYLKALDYTYDLKTMQYVKRPKKDYAAYEVSRLASLLIDAMEAVTYAEAVKRAEDIRAETYKEIKRNGGATSADEIEARVKQKLHQENAAMQEKRKQWGLNGKQKSMEGRDETRAACLAQWRKSPHLLRLSNNKAGLRIHDWLVEQDLAQVEPGTISKWISEWKKSSDPSQTTV